MHTKYWKTPLLAVAGLLFLSLSASAQTSTLSGAVKGEDGKPLKDAIIKIERTDIKGNYKTKTNKKGEWIHAGLPLGMYNITCEVNGAAKDSVRGVRTRLGDPTEINFDLEELAKKQAAMQQAAQTGEITKEQARDMTPEQRAQLEKAMKEREKAMAKNKALNDAFNQGMAALQAKQYDAAADAFQKASEMDATQNVIFAQLAEARVGQAMAKTGEEQATAYNQAFEAYKKAIELKPDDAGYHNNFALALARAKKFDEAEAELNKAAQMDPTKAGMYYYNLGALLVNNQQLEPAGAAFKKAIEADPNHADSHYQYGIYLMSKAQTDASGKVTPAPGTAEAFQKYLELKPDGPYAESAKGMLQMMNAGVETEYKNPDSVKKKGKKK